MKQDTIEIWVTQGQGQTLIWKGFSYKRALIELYKIIGSGSIGLKINGKLVS